MSFKRNDPGVMEIPTWEKALMIVTAGAVLSVFPLMWYYKSYLPEKEKEVQEKLEKAGPERFINSERGVNRGY